MMYYGIAGASFLLMLTLVSCRKDDSAPLPELKSSTFSSSTLNLSYDGELMPGKSVDFKVGAGHASQAEMTLYSVFDLSQLSGLGLSGSLPGPGVIPGSPQLTIPVNLTPGDGCYTFSGAYTATDASFNYVGRLESDLLYLNIANATLSNQMYAGKVFSPSPIIKEGLANYTSLPFHIKWELDPASGVDIPLSDLLKTIVVAPVIPVYNNTAYMSLAQAYCNVVKTICLSSDGNIPVVYISTIGGAAHLATTTGNMLQYVPSDNGIKLYVNPLSAVSEVLLALSKPQTDAEFVTKSVDSDSYNYGMPSSVADSGLSISPAIKTALLKSLLTTISPQLSQGIPLEVATTEKGVDIYFDTDTSVRFLASLLQNLLEDPVISTALKTYLEQLNLPQLPPSDIDALLGNLSTFLERTTCLEIGLSLEKWQGEK